MTKGIIVTIGGQNLAQKWDGSDLVAADRVAIRWGRTDPYDDDAASVLSMTLIDRTGTFISARERVGEAVTVAIADTGRVVFRGFLTKPRATRRRLHNPLTNTPETVWIVSVTASDKLAQAGQIVLLGTATAGDFEGAGGWREVKQGTRLTQLEQQGALSVVSSIERPPPPPDDVARTLHGQAVRDQLTLAELIRQVYKVSPLGVPLYDAAADGIVLSKFSPSAPVALVLSGGKIRLSIPGGDVIDAGRVGVLNGYTLEADSNSAIDVVQVAYWYYGNDPNLGAGDQKRQDYYRSVIEKPTKRFDGQTRRALRIDTELMTFDNSVFAGPRDKENRAPGWLLDSVVQVVDALNGQLSIPALTFNANRLPLPADVEDRIYRTTPATGALYFPGSVFGAIPGVSPQFQILGGTLTYDDGWTHEVTLSATGSAAPSTLTWAQLITNTTVTGRDFDPALTGADLANVTIGL